MNELDKHICSQCNGSGEGMVDGSSCGYCNGKGIIYTGLYICPECGELTETKNGYCFNCLSVEIDKNRSE